MTDTDLVPVKAPTDTKTGYPSLSLYGLSGVEHDG